MKTVNLSKQISAHIPYKLWQQVIRLKANGISMTQAIVEGLEIVVKNNESSK